MTGSRRHAWEASLPLLNQARALLAAASRPGAGERAAVRELAGSLELAGALAGQAAIFYRECAVWASAGTLDYTPGGPVAADGIPIRTLGEG